MDSSSAALLKCWLLAHLASGAPRFWAAISIPESTHCLCQCLDVPSQGQAKPQHQSGLLCLDWLFPGSSPEGAGGLSQGHYIGKHLACTSAQCSEGVHPGARQPPGSLSELQPGWRCASALQTAGQSMSCCSEPLSGRAPRQPEVYGHHNWYNSTDGQGIWKLLGQSGSPAM